MAQKIKGITIELGADITGIKRALKDVNKSIKDTSNELKQVDRLLKIDPKNTELLAQKQELLTKEISDTTSKLEALKKAKENADASGSEKDEHQYRYLQREIIATEQQLANLAKQADETAEALNMQDDAEDMGDTIANAAGKAKVAVAAVGAAIVAAGASAVEFSSESTAALDSFIAKTGIAAKSAGKYENVMNDIYESNYGENMNDIAEAMGIVAQNSKDMDSSKVKELTTNALILRDTFGFDVSETMRAANMLMDQFGVSGNEAFNLIAQGAQQGLNKNGDLLDSINEYSVHFKQLGLDVNEMFNSLANSTSAGTFSVDKLGDAIKEFGIRAKDNSSGTKEAFTSLGLNADELTKKFAAGGEEGKEAFEKVTNALFATDDKVKQNEAGVALFGTMWEDLGTDGVKALTDLNGGISTTKNTLDDINKVKYNDAKSSLTQLKKSIETNIVKPVGDKLAPSVKHVAECVELIVPTVGKTVESTMNTIGKFNKWLTDNDPTSVRIAERIEEAKKEADLTKALEEKRQAIESTIETYEEYREQQAEIASQGLIEVTNTQKLADELLTLADANGVVNESSRGRAQFILNELNKALGTEYSMTGNIINNYKSLKDSINQLVEAKRYEILMEEAEADYSESIKGQAEALNQMYEAYNNGNTEAYNKAKEHYDKLLADQETYEEASRLAMQEGTTAAINYLNQRKEAYDDVSSGAENYVTNSEKALRESADAYAKSLITLESALKNYNKTGSETAKATVEAAISEVQNSKDRWEAAGGEVGSSVLKGMQGGTTSVGNFAKSISSMLKEAINKGLSVDDGFLADMTAVGEYSQKVQEKNLETMRKYLKNASHENKQTSEEMAATWEKIKTEPIGVNFSKGLASGITAGKSDVINAAQGVSDSAVNAAKNKLKIKSPSQVMRDEVGKYISLGMASGIEENGDEVVKAFKSVLEKLDYQKEFGIISDDEYYTELEKLRDKYFKSGTKEWLDYTKKIYDYQEKQLEETKKAYKDTYEDIYKYASDKIDAVIKKQQDYSKKLNSYGKLFKNVTISLDEGDISYYSIKDFKKETEDIEHYNELLQNLRSELINSGIDDDASSSFFDEINSMSVDEGIKALEALGRVNADELSNYINAYAEKYKLSQNLSSDMYKPDMEQAVSESRDYMQKVLSESGFLEKTQGLLDKISDAFADGGTASAEAFGTNFLNKIQSVFGQLENSLLKFNVVADVGNGTAAQNGTNINNTNNSKNISVNIKNMGNTSTAYQQRVEAEKMLDRLALQGVL